MKIFVFGAGASQGSQGVGVIPDECKAPLSDELFDLRYQKYANAVGLNESTMNEYRNDRLADTSFESWLTNQWRKIDSINNPLAKNAQKGFLAQIAFYIWYLLINVSKWTCNNKGESRNRSEYLFLMKNLRKMDCAFGLINFNYDLLLDYACIDTFKITFQNIDDYLAFNYVKPHGSINWLLKKREVEPNIDRHELDVNTKVRLNTAINRMYSGDPIPINSVVVKEPDHRDLYTLDNLIYSFNQQYFYPLIFLPLTAKAYSSIAGFEEKIVGKANSLLEEASEIYLIGYNANDSLIKDMLKNAPQGTKLHVVGKSSTVEIMERMLAILPNLVRGNCHSNGFHDFVFNVVL